MPVTQTIEQRVSGLKVMAQMLLQEATIIEKELSLATGSAPRKGLSKKHIDQLHKNSSRSLVRRVLKSKA